MVTFNTSNIPRDLTIWIRKLENGDDIGVAVPLDASDHQILEAFKIFRNVRTSDRMTASLD